MIGTVYFIQAVQGGPIKIGHTSGDPQQRAQTMQTGSPNELQVIGSCPGTRFAEQALHAELEVYRVRGEWFADCPEVRAAMQRAIEGRVAQPDVSALECGCVPGYSFCADADQAWRDVGLARARSDSSAYIVALKRFGDHLEPRIAADELAPRRAEREYATDLHAQEKTEPTASLAKATVGSNHIGG